MGFSTNCRTELPLVELIFLVLGGGVPPVGPKTNQGSDWMLTWLQLVGQLLSGAHGCSKWSIWMLIC